MSAGIIVMNKNGLALAADSAVTDSQGKTSYNANKLFKMSEVNPVGAIVYENAEFMQKPMGNIIAQYVSDRGNQSFPHLEEQAVDFLEFLKRNTGPFTEEDEAVYVEKTCEGVLEMFRRHVDVVCEENNIASIEMMLLACDFIFTKALERLRSDIYPPKQKKRKKSNSLSAYVLKQYGEQIESEIKMSEAAKKLNGFTDKQAESIKTMICDSFDNPCFPAGFTGIVIAGYGQKERLPRLRHLALGGIMDGKLKYFLRERPSVCKKTPSVILPVAQTDVIKTFLTGVDETLVGQLDDNAQKTAMEVMNKNLQPIKESMADSSVEDMASFAETMINITSLRRKWVKDEKYGTVGGPTDVAVITKKPGFVWVKCK